MDGAQARACGQQARAPTAPGTRAPATAGRAGAARARERIRAKWLAWRGPATPGYFIYVAEVETGEYEARAQLSRERNAELRRTIHAQLAAEANAQASLSL